MAIANLKGRGTVNDAEHKHKARWRLRRQTWRLCFGTWDSRPTVPLARLAIHQPSILPEELPQYSSRSTLLLRDDDSRHPKL